MKNRDALAHMTAKPSTGVWTAAGGVVALMLLLGLSQAAQAQVPSDPNNYSRASSFTYRSDGLLQTETVEPDNVKLCVVTTYGYDGWGNKVSAASANCAGVATGDRAYFAPRTNTSKFDAAQTVRVGSADAVSPAGTFPWSSSNALSQSETRSFDPRFGAVVSQTVSSNGLSTRWTVDDFGRTVREQRADGTSTITAYCLIAGRVSDTSSNSAACAGLTYAANEIPADAVSLVHTEPHDNSDADIAPAASAKNGPYRRVYMDRLGRKIRSTTEGFDGSVIAQDVDYNVYGAQTVSTQPYFLATQSSAITGAAHYGMSLNVYDVLGRVIATYNTDVANVPVTGMGNVGGNKTSISFGSSRGTYQATVTTFDYDGLSTTSTNDQGKTRVEVKNISAKVVKVTDALDGQVTLQYDAFGNLASTKDALLNTITLRYDIRGRKVSLSDPDSGLWQYDYDALGELVWQQNATQRAVTPTAQSTVMAYDKLGRMTSRTEAEYISTWSYDKYADGTSCMDGTLAGRSAGKLCESGTDRGVNHRQYYDSLGRLVNSKTTIVTGSTSQYSAMGYGYDSTSGRLDNQTYPTGLKLKYNYNAKGYVSSLSTVSSVTVNPMPATPGGVPAASRTLTAGTSLWTAQAVNAWDRTEQALLGSGTGAITTRTRFDPSTGRVISNTAGLGTGTQAMNYNYLWFNLGRLGVRSDINGDGSSGSVTDNYGYDDLGRLTSYTVTAPALNNFSRSVSLDYNAVGMLKSKSDVGTYTYPTQAGGVGSKPHAVQNVAGTTYGYDANGNLTSATAGPYRSIAYTSFNLPDSQAGLRGPSGSPQYTWQYDENHQRIKETRVVASGPNAGTRTTWMMHPDNQGGLGFESESAPDGTISNRHYLSANGQAIGVLVTKGALPTPQAGQAYPLALGSVTAVKLEYWHKDHLGSLVSTSDHLGAVTARYAYDPFGKRRQLTGAYDANGTLVADWTTNTNRGTDRGYTGHEHLDDVGVVHMNGRIFDPRLGRFMQADPMIQDQFNLQNYDRYTYCYNNPLVCTDPSGEEVWFTDPSTGANTYYTDTGNGTASNTYNGDTYVYQANAAQNGYGNGVGAYSLAGATNEGAGAVGSYSNGGWTPTQFGQELASNEHYNFGIQVAIAAATQDQSAINWDGPSRSWLIEHLDAYLVSTAKDQVLGKALMALPAGSGKVVSGFLARLLRGRSAAAEGAGATATATAEDAGATAAAAKEAPRLAAPAMHDHHLMPRQFREFFAKRGIDIEAHTVSLGEKSHLTGVHGKGLGNMPGGWNKEWAAWIQKNPNATAKEIYQQLGSMMDRFKINDLAIHPYRQ
jgi:RHS repeat-associated protein